MLSYVNPTKRNMRKKQNLTLLATGAPIFPPSLLLAVDLAKKPKLTKAEPQLGTAQPQLFLCFVLFCPSYRQKIKPFLDVESNVEKNGKKITSSRIEKKLSYLNIDVTCVNVYLKEKCDCPLHPLISLAKCRMKHLKLDEQPEESMRKCTDII